MGNKELLSVNYGPMTVRPEPFEDLVISMLAVNSFSLERAYNLRDRLDQQGLFTMETIAGLTTGEIAERLDVAGYRRGSFMNPLLADRIKRLVTTVKLTDLHRALESGNAVQLKNALNGLPGIGPTVIRNYLLLRSV